MTRRVEIIDKKKYVAAVLNRDNKIFVIHIAALVEPIIMSIYSSHQVQVILLKSKENRISIEYSDFSNVFSSDSAVELTEHTRIKDYPINLLNNK